MLKKIGKRLKDQRGLTLVELLAVVVILGVIAGIAVPSIGNVIAKSKFDAAKADAIQLINAGKMYAAASGNTTKTFSDASQGELAQYIDITTENLSTWTVTIVDGNVTVSATSKHPGKTGTPVIFSGNLKAVNDYKYENK